MSSFEVCCEMFVSLHVALRMVEKLSLGRRKGLNKKIFFILLGTF